MDVCLSLVVAAVSDGCLLLVGSGIRWMSTVSGGSGIRWMSTVRARRSLVSGLNLQKQKIILNKISKGLCRPTKVQVISNILEWWQ